MLYHPPSQCLVLKVPDPFALRELIPRSKVLDHPQFNIAVKACPEAATILRNLGYHLPIDINNNYAWPGRFRPFWWQKVMAKFMAERNRCFNLSEPGTGKTAAALWGADWLMNQGIVKKVLILAPLSILQLVWAQAIFELLMHRRGVVVHGSLERRMKALATDSHFYILNHDGLTIPPLARELRDRIGKDISLVIVDEGGLFRNDGTSKYKCLASILRPSTRLWWLTGTPTPNEPTDAWSQVRLVAPERITPYPGKFKRLTMYQVNQYRWLPNRQASDIVFKAMQPAIRFKKKECLDLPPVISAEHEVEMTLEQRRAFRRMHNAMVMEYEQNKKRITAVNAADKLNKIRQIFCGAILDPNTQEYIALPHGPRLNVLKQIIETAAAKVIVVAPFKGIVRILSKELGNSVGVLNGDVSFHDRNRIITSFKTQIDPHILLCHPVVMSHGLNLTEADTLVFWGPIYSNDSYQQVIERFNRAGQTRKMLVARMGTHPIEWDIYNILDKRQGLQENILNLYSKLMERGPQL